MRMFTTLILAIMLLSVLFPINIIKAQLQGEIGVSASVQACEVTFLLKPEKRIPREGNFSNTYSIIIFDNKLTKIYNIDKIETDKDGRGSWDFCSKNITPTSGVYSIYVKGTSHLGKLFENVNGFYNYSTEFNLARFEGDYLLAGDVEDNNYINSIDINQLVLGLYTSEKKYDLNQDGIVNSLDLSNQIYNLHKSVNIDI